MFDGAMVHVMENTEKIVNQFNKVILPEITGNSFNRVGTNYRDWGANNSFDLYLDYPYSYSEKTFEKKINRQPTTQPEICYYDEVKSVLYDFAMILIENKKG